MDNKDLTDETEVIKMTDSIDYSDATPEEIEEFKKKIEALRKKAPEIIRKKIRKRLRDYINQ